MFSLYEMRFDNQILFACTFLEKVPKKYRCTLHFLRKSAQKIPLHFALFEKKCPKYHYTFLEKVPKKYRCTLHFLRKSAQK